MDFPGIVSIKVYVNEEVEQSSMNQHKGPEELTDTRL